MNPKSSALCGMTGVPVCSFARMCAATSARMIRGMLGLVRALLCAVSALFALPIVGISSPGLPGRSSSLKQQMVTTSLGLCVIRIILVNSCIMLRYAGQCPPARPHPIRCHQESMTTLSQTQTNYSEDQRNYNEDQSELANQC